jgi:predicted O-methyltransferase YrrM
MNDLDYTPTEKIDVLFIDTDHTYRQTLKELVKFAPWVRDNGVIILHDTEHCPEVKKAINTFLNTCLDKYIFENRENNNGLGILWQRQASSYLVG